MQDGLTAEGFYVDAKSVLQSGGFDQGIEDEIDLLMEKENDLLEDEEIEELLQEEWEVHRQQQQIEVTPSEFTEFAIKIPVGGEIVPFSFEGRRYLPPIYNTPARNVLLKCARQTEKSTLLGNKAIAYSGINLAFKTLYVSSTATQAQVFSVDRVKEPIDISPELSFMLDSKLSQNVLFKQFKNRSQIRIRYAYLNADRCLHGSSLVQLADGSRITIKDMSEKGGEFSVISSNEEGSPFVAKATNAHYSGQKRIVKVETDYPINLVCSFDHPLLTGRGWVKAEELTSEDFIAAPHPALSSLGLFDKEAQSIGEDWAWLLGAMVSEGECSKKGSIRFTNSDEEFLEEFELRSRRVGLSIGERVKDERDGFKTCWSVGVYSDRRGQGLNGAKKYLWELGEFGKKAGDKFIPLSIWKVPIEEKAIFLWALFNGDGWCCPDNGGARAGYSSSSKRLVEDVACLLWDLGIRSSVSKKKPSTKKASVSYTVNLSKNPTAKLIDLIGPFRETPIVPTQKQDKKDRIPLTYLQLREILRTKYGLSTHAAWMQHRIQLRPGNVKDSIGRRVLESIAVKLSDQELLNKVSSDRSWVRVKSITEEGISDVYDLTVEGPGCFVSNGLVVHNTRGIPADHILIDEIQDIIYENIPVIEQCASHSPWKLTTYSGTPKTLDNTIELYWSKFSTQNEWVVPCESCGSEKDKSTWHWNVLGMKNIGKQGLICSKCKRAIDATHPDAQWASMNPVTKDNLHLVTYEGYRIPQLMVPWIEWNDILVNLEKYDTARFYNEVLGLSYDSGVRPLTRGQVKACCKDSIHYNDVIENAEKCSEVFAGIDWGSGESHSFTVLTLGGYMPDIGFTIFFTHRFVGEDLEPRLQLEKIARLLTRVNFKICGTDYGGGFDRNDWLMRNFGPMKLVKYQYAGNPKYKVRWQPALARFILHRTEIMSDIFNAVKYRRFSLPSWEEFRTPYGDDMLNIFSEYNHQIKMTQYKNSPGKADDTFHSILYCVLASMIVKPRPDIIVPLREGSVNFSIPGQ